MVNRLTNLQNEHDQLTELAMAYEELQARLEAVSMQALHIITLTNATVGSNIERRIPVWVHNTARQASPYAEEAFKAHQEFVDELAVYDDVIEQEMNDREIKKHAIELEGLLMQYQQRFGSFVCSETLTSVANLLDRAKDLHNTSEVK